MRGFDCIPSVPPSLFNGFAGVAHSLAIWPQPWHLKHCTALESFALWALPWAPVDAWVLHPTLGSSGYPTCSRGAASGGVLAQASLTNVGAGADRSIPLHLSSPMMPVPGTIWSASRAECPVLLCLEWPLTWQFGHPALLSHLSLQWEQMTMLLPFLLHPLSCSQLFWLLPLAGSMWSQGYHADTLLSLLYACAPLWNSWSLRCHATLWSAILSRALELNLI